MSINEWIKNAIFYIHVMECYLAIRNKKVLPFVTTWMNLEDIMLNEENKMQKDKCYIISLMCGGSEKKI
jgi:hypothetical protein